MLCGIAQKEGSRVREFEERRERNSEGAEQYVLLIVGDLSAALIYNLVICNEV